MADQRNLTMVFDVDGVMTTGRFLYSVRGKEFKIFGPHDADGLKLLAGKLPFFFVTADRRGLGITRKRIEQDLGHTLFVVGEEERMRFLEQRVGMSSLIYMGDGYYDAPILKKCFYGLAPANARTEAKEAADFVTPSQGGEGAVLDACLHILNKFCV